MKDMRARSGTYLQDFPTSEPPYFKHSFLLSWLQSRAVTFTWGGGGGLMGWVVVNEEEEEDKTTFLSDR